MLKVFHLRAHHTAYQLIDTVLRAVPHGGCPVPVHSQEGQQYSSNVATLSLSAGFTAVNGAVRTVRCHSLPECW